MSMGAEMPAMSMGGEMPAMSASAAEGMATASEGMAMSTGTALPVYTEVAEAPKASGAAEPMAMAAAAGMLSDVDILNL
jgi:hypothetical protein